MNSATPAEAPLAGVCALELGSSVAAPVAAQILAELGADVIKIERPVGDDARMWGPPFVQGASPLFQAINRNKKSAVVDLKDAGQCAALRAYIAAEVDVVLQNMRPGLVARFGLDAGTLRAEKPSLIYCNLAAYGASGPLASSPGYDPLMQAFGGLMSLTGHEGQAPVRVQPSIVDQGAAMWSAIGIVSALFRRLQTGEGCEVSTSLYETALAWIPPQMATYRANGRVPRPLGTENPGIVPYKAYEADDGWIVVAAGNDNLFRRLAEALGHAEWATDPRFRTNPDRVAHRELLNAAIAAVIATQSRGTWLARLETAGVPCAPLLTLDEVAAHPQFEAVGMSQHHPDSAIPLMGVPLQFDGVRPPFRLPPPRLGQHTHVVLGDGESNRQSE